MAGGNLTFHTRTVKFHSVMYLMYSDMPPKRAVSAKEKSTKNDNKDSKGDKSLPCRRVEHPTQWKLDVVDEGTREYYLMQIRDLENRVAR